MTDPEKGEKFSARITRALGQPRRILVLTTHEKWQTFKGIRNFSDMLSRDFTRRVFEGGLAMAALVEGLSQGSKIFPRISPELLPLANYDYIGPVVTQLDALAETPIGKGIIALGLAFYMAKSALYDRGRFRVMGKELDDLVDVALTQPQPPPDDQIT